MRAIGWVEFQKKYYPSKVTKEGDEPQAPLKDLFKKYEVDFQRIVYRRFKRLYTTNGEEDPENPQAFEKIRETLGITERKALDEEEHLIIKEKKREPKIGIVVPDHRIRRL
jgi:hypothetical protein